MFNILAVVKSDSASSGSGIVIIVGIVVVIAFVINLIMNNKYYTPEIEEFHIGFEYEELINKVYVPVF